MLVLNPSSQSVFTFHHCPTVMIPVLQKLDLFQTQYCEYEVDAALCCLSRDPASVSPCLLSPRAWNHLGLKVGRFEVSEWQRPVLLRPRQLHHSFLLFLCLSWVLYSLPAAQNSLRLSQLPHLLCFPDHICYFLMLCTSLISINLVPSTPEAPWNTKHVKFCLLHHEAE